MYAVTVDVDHHPVRCASIVSVVPPLETATLFITLHRTLRPASVDCQKPGRDRMFRCQHCGTVTPPHVSAERVVVEARAQVNPPRSKVQREIVWKKPLKRWEHQDDPGGTGREIVRELMVCPPCKQSLQPGPITPTS